MRPRKELRSATASNSNSPNPASPRTAATAASQPITDANRDEALAGPDISEAEHEVTLTEERPDVEKEAVPVERVRLAKEAEQTEETVR